MRTATATTTKTAKTISLKKLTNQYDAYAPSVLSDFLVYQGKSKYKLTRPLPTPDEYEELKAKEYTRTIADWLVRAKDDVSDLTEKVELLLCDNEDEEKEDRFEEAASILDSIEIEEAPKKVADIPVFFLLHLRATSIADVAYENYQLLFEIGKAINHFVECSKLKAKMKKELQEYSESLFTAANELEMIDVDADFSF